MMGYGGRAISRIGDRFHSMIESWMPLAKPLAGMEITPSCVKTVRVEKRRRGWVLTRCGELPFPPSTVKCSYKEPSISDTDAFQDTVWSALEAIGGDVGRIGVSLPNETLKVFVQEFDELPGTPVEIEKMVKWWVEKTFRISPDDFRVSFQLLEESMEGKPRLLMALGVAEVIRQYEMLLRELNIQPEIVLPAGINQFNFYCNEIPSIGVVAYMGFFETYFVFIVVENGNIIFFHGVKKGPSDSHFNHYLDMTLQFFFDTCPGKKIESLHMGYPGHFYRDLAEDLIDIIGKNIVIIDESRFVGLETETEPSHPFPMTTYSGAIGSARCISYFSAAIGAAQSLDV